MSIIRDFIEYYRLPAEIKVNLLDFEIKHTLLNGREERYYYALDGSNHYTMIVDMFTHDSVRYRRTYMTYNTNFGILYITSEYEYGKKSRTDTFVYGSGATEGAVIQVDTVETDTNIVWSNPPPSTGWPYYDFGGRVQSIVAGVDIDIDNTDARNPVVNVIGDFVSRDQLYTILGDYTQVKFDWFTWVDGKYGTRGQTVSNESVQYWIVPQAEEDTIIKVHLWGASGGGYTYGELIVKKPENYIETNPTHVMSGQKICVHVGGYLINAASSVGRAAIWRNDTNYFNSYTNELLVAGGGGGGYPEGYRPVSGDWPYLPGGYGGTQTAGGQSANDGQPGGDGQRVWGGYYTVQLYEGTGTSWKHFVAGDGYYGGGSGTYHNDFIGPNGIIWASGGGGGSNYLAPGFSPVSEDWVGPTYPPGASLPAWGMSAGQPGFAGRVTFETNTLVATNNDTKPIVTDIVPLRGNIFGGDITRTGNNQLTISPISCMDSNDNVALYKATSTLLNIPLTPINQIYHIFVVKLVVDGSITFKAYTSEAAVDSDATVDAYRWLCFWRTDPNGYCYPGIFRNGLLAFGGNPIYQAAHNYYYNEPEFLSNPDGNTPPPLDTSNAGIPAGGGIFTLYGVGVNGATTHSFIDISSVIPIERVRKVYPYVYGWRTSGVNMYVSIGIKDGIAPGIYGSFMQGTDLVLSLTAYHETTANAVAFIKSVEIIN